MTGLRAPRGRRAYTLAMTSLPASRPSDQLAGMSEGRVNNRVVLFKSR